MVGPFCNLIFIVVLMFSYERFFVIINSVLTVSYAVLLRLIILASEHTPISVHYFLLFVKDYFLFKCYELSQNRL